MLKDLEPGVHMIGRRVDILYSQFSETKLLDNHSGIYLFGPGQTVLQVLSESGWTTDGWEEMLYEAIL